MKRAMKLASFIVPVLILSLSFGACQAWSQEVRATIGGRVTDPQGATITGATVTVTSDETGVEHQTQTNAQGNWSVQFLLPGTYRFSVAVAGFKTAERRGVLLQAADNKEIDTQLEVGASTQSVVVTGEAPLIDTTSGTSGTVITAEQISELPSATHVSTLLAGLSPGVLIQDQTPGNTHMWSNIGGSAVLADGGRGNRSNLIILDGMPDTKSNGDISFIPPSDSIEEFRVQTNAYDAAISRQAGATINLQTKSGGKDYHGSLYEYNQNNFLNAYFIQSKVVKDAINPIHFNEWGGTFGGPVWIPKVYNGKKKTFFFVSFDDTHNIDPRGGGLRSVPTGLERNGDFSQSFTTQASTGTRMPVQVYNPFVLLNVKDGNPATDRAPAGVFRAQFRCADNQFGKGFGDPIVPNTAGLQLGGNACMGPDPNDPTKTVYRPRIPMQLLSPIAQKILKYVPLANIPGDPTSNASRNFRPTATRTDTFPVLSIRADQNWSNSHHSFLALRWNHLHEFLDDFFGTAATGNFQERVSHGLGLDHVWTLSSTKIVDLRFSVNRFRQPNTNKGSGFDPTQLGLPASFVSQLRTPSFPRIVGFAGDFGVDQAGATQISNFYTWTGSLTQIHGNHTLHYGSEYWVMQEANNSIGNQGQFDFNNDSWIRQSRTMGGCPGTCANFGTFLLGLPVGGNVPSNADSFYSQRFFGVYFQDDWRVSSKLTLNLGLRWDYERPVTERYNRLTSNFDISALNPISPPVQAAYATIQGPGRTPTQRCTDAGVTTNQAQCVDALNRLKTLAPADQFKIPGAQLFAGVGSQPRTFSNTDLHEWQPRVGAAYRITPNTVIRGGVGRFTQATFEKGGQNGFSRSTPLVASSDNLLIAPNDTLADPFHTGILRPTGASLGPLTNLGQGVSWDNQNPNRPYSWEYSLHLQHQLKKWLFEVGYSHNKTYGIYFGRVLDNPPFALWQDLRSPRDAQGNPLGPNGNPADTLLWDAPVPNPFKGVTVPGCPSPCISGGLGSGQTVAMNRLLFGDPLLGSVSRNTNPVGKNQYDALLAKIEHRFSSGFSIIGAFTFSKLYEDTSIIGPEIAGALVEHKLGGEDRPMRLSIASVWELPFGRGKRFGSTLPQAVNAFVGGWELTSQYTIQSGVPLVFVVNNDASIGAFFTGKDPKLPSDQRTLQRWFDTSQFIPFPGKNTDISNYPAWTGIQNLPGFGCKPCDTRNGVYQDFANFVRRFPTRFSDVRAPGVNEVNLGIYKNFHFTERVKFQLRLDAFNAFNHARYPGADTNWGSNTFGQVTQQQDNAPRQIELAGKLTF